MTVNDAASVETLDESRNNDEKVRAELLEFVHNRTGVALEPSTDLFDRGLISSMFAMELVVHVEETYDIEVEGPDLAISNFRTIESMAELVRRLRGAGHDA